MLCYYYPPLADVGTKRSIAFSKYFKKYGWEPVVISVKNPDRTYCLIGNEDPPCEICTEYSYSIINLYKFLGKCNALLAHMVKVMGIKIKRNYLYDIFCIPDIFWGWIPLTIIKGLKLIKRNHIDVIYVSCSPFSAALIGICLKAVTGKPLIIDFRDIYALEVESVKYASAKPLFREKIDKWFENKILNWVNLFIVTSKEMQSMYEQKYPQIDAKIFTVHNGVEPEVLSAYRPVPKYLKFTIAYAGNFYFEAVGRELFFEALALLHRKGEIHKANFQFIYYGDWSKAIREMSRGFHVEDLVLVNPSISHETLFPIIKRSHLQLLRIIKPMISTKLFEGIALNIPLLAIIPAGEVEEIIKEYSPSSYVVTDQSSEKIADAILDAMHRYEKNKIQDNNVCDFLKRFSRENLTLKIMKIIENNITLRKDAS